VRDGWGSPVPGDSIATARRDGNFGGLGLQPQHAALVAEVYRQYPHSRLLAKAAVLIEKAGGQQ